MLRAVVWMVLRGDAATAATFASEIGSYEPGPLRDAAQGALATAADDPLAAERVARPGLETGAPSSIAKTAAIIALLIGIHWFGRLNAAATVEWCERAQGGRRSGQSAVRGGHDLPAARPRLRRPSEEAIREAVVAEARPGDPVHRWLNAQSARGLLRLVDDDLEGARADLESSGTAASGLGILNTAAFAFAYLARAEWVAGLWDDALVHAERAVAINLESDFGFLQTAVIGIAVLVPAARGDWAHGRGLSCER